MALEISILSLNVWGIPFVSLDRKERMKAIGDELSTGEYDIVSLQEVWSESDYQLLKNKTEKVLPYAHYFYSGVAGSGLCLLSKYPIIAAFFHAWSVNGYVHRIQHGDWFGGKGVGLCRLIIENQTVNIYVAHLHAEYDTKNDDYKAHRVIQAFDTAQFIETTRSNSVLQILAGDLNAEPHDISYRVLMKSANLQDTFDTSNLIGTNECDKNYYTSPSIAKDNPIGKRIDHILIRAGDNYEVNDTKYDLPLPSRVPGKDFSFSDHEAIRAKIKVNAKNTLQCERDGYCGFHKHNSFNEKFDFISTIEECIEICDDSLRNLSRHRIFYLTASFIFAFILFTMIDISPPYGLKTLFLLLKFIFSGFIIFCIFMATLWNVMERHGILSGKLSMEVALNKIQKYDHPLRIP